MKRGDRVVTPQGPGTLLSIGSTEVIVRMDFGYNVIIPSHDVKPLDACTNCGDHLEGRVWKSRDGFFCSEACGITYNYLGRPLPDNFTTGMVVKLVKRFGETNSEALERVQMEATRKWKQYAKEVTFDATPKNT